MSTLASVLYLLTCVVFASLSARQMMVKSKEKDSVTLFLTWVVLFFALFFGGYFVLGFINLAFNLPVVNPYYGSVVALVTLGASCLYFPEMGSVLTKRDYHFGQVRNVVDGVSMPGKGLSRALGITTFFTFVLIALMIIPGFPRGFEASAYHLPLAVNIIQSQSLKIWDTSFLHTHPANASIYFSFLLRFISEHLLTVSNFVFVFILVVATYGLGRAIGADKIASLLAALGILSIPIIGIAAFEAEADLGGVAFLAIAVFFTIAKSDHPLLHQILGGLAAGLAFGFKSLHLISAAFLFFLILLLASRKSRDKLPKIGFTSSFYPALVFLISFFSMAAFWLVRNQAQLGNPLYPVYLPLFEMFGWTKAPDIDYLRRSQTLDTQFEFVRSSIEWYAYPWLEWHYIGQNYKGSSGLGAFFACAVPVACLTSLIRVFKGTTQRRHAIASLLVGGILVFSVWWVLGDRQPRYCMGALIFLVPLVASTVSQTGGLYRTCLEFVIALCMCFMLFVIFSQQLVEFGSSFLRSRNFTRHAFYGYPSAIDNLPQGSVIVNLSSRPNNYGLYGKTLQNRVVNFMESIRILAEEPPKKAWLWNLDAEEASNAYSLRLSTLKELGATHLYTMGYPKLLLDKCVALQEIDHLDKNPVNGVSLPKPLILWDISYCR